MTVFINLTAHQLTDEQKKTAASEFGATEFVDFKDIEPDLFGKLLNSPSDEGEISDIARDTILAMSRVHYRNSGNVIFHLPIGSPAMMFALATLLSGHYYYPTFYGNVVVSHSERSSKEIQLPDGGVKKESVFSFVKFIKVT